LQSSKHNGFAIAKVFLTTVFIFCLFKK